MRRFRRFRWLLPALAIPGIVIVVGLGMQAAAFRRASQDSLVAAGTVRELLRYHVMRGDEHVGLGETRSVCVQGWFRAPRHRHLVRGALVLLENGERLYDVGAGVQQLTRHGSHAAGPLDRARFVLAGCPRFIGDRVGTRLVRGNRVEELSNRVDGRPALTIVLAGNGSKLALAVNPRTYRPVALGFGNGTVHGWSDLEPGGGRPMIVRVRRAFRLPVVPRHAHA